MNLFIYKNKNRKISRDYQYLLIKELLKQYLLFFVVN